MSAKKSTHRKKISYKPFFLHYLGCLSIVPVLILTSINFNKVLTNNKVLGASIDTSSLQTEKLYWQKIIVDNPTYTDGYLQLAKVDTELGNKNEAKFFIDKAISLEPNSTKITEIQKQLGL